ncbi:MAG: ComEC/Rec2 family competence protein [Pedobacter sp.]|nr:ComEC/Rec2 family competence protein [Pedobacter sp.]MDQ8052121.1 ComEC/Rec2 family competence protein [Pedobacter sp.]
MSGFLYLLLIAFQIGYVKMKAYRFKGIIGQVIMLFWFAFGILNTLIFTLKSQPLHFSNYPAKYLKGWICNEPQQSKGNLRFEVAIVNSFAHQHAVITSGKLAVQLKIERGKLRQLKYGDEVIIPCNYTNIEVPYNPGEFDYRNWLANKHFYHQTFIRQDQLITLRTNVGNPIIAYALDSRKRQVDRYRKLIQNNEAFSVASTLVLGYRADLSQETLNAYSKTGTIHALSVSGMHVGIIYIFLNWVLFFLDRHRLLRILKCTLICSLIWYYALLTGFSPSVLRSAIMLTVFILAKTFNRSSNSYNILAFTAFSLLIYDPMLLWDVGFQLSFLAVFGLIYLQPKIYAWLVVPNYWLDRLWATVAISIAAQVATFPLSIYYFHQFPLYFIFSNLFILLPLTAMMYLGIGILLLNLNFLAPIFEWIIKVTNSGLKWIAELPFSGINGIWIDQWQLLLLCIALTLCIFSLVNYQKKILFTAFALLCVFQCSLTFQKINHLHQLKVLGFSLRKDYAMAFIEGSAATVVTNLTKADQSFDFFIRPALESLHISKITCINWETDTTIGKFSKREHQLAFHRYHLLLIDSCFDQKKIVGLPYFDAIWMHQNPKKKILQLRNEVIFSTLISDASNKEFLLKKNTQIANKINLHHLVLKKNKAYLVNLNP